MGINLLLQIMYIPSTIALCTVDPYYRIALSGVVSATWVKVPGV